MEIPCSFSFFTVLISILIISLKLLSTRRQSRLKLPPGPPKFPIIGNLPQLASKNLGPHQVLFELAKVHGPIMHLCLGEVPTVVVTSAEVAKEVLKTHDGIFANRPNLLLGEKFFHGRTDIVLAPYGEYWRQMRKICTLELFTLKRIESFRHIREEEVSNLVKTLSSQAGSVVNLSNMLFSLMFDITLRMTMGKKSSQVKAFKDMIEEMRPLAAGFSLPDLYPSFKWLYTISSMRRTIQKLHLDSNAIMDPIIEEHKSRRRGQVQEEDLVDVLLAFEKNDATKTDFSLTTNNIKSVIIELFGAGSDTTSSTIEWAMSELLKNPKVMKKAQEEVRRIYQGKGTVDEEGLHELNFLKLVVKETLRLHPVIPFLVPRESLEECKVYGYDIPSKTRIIVNAWAIGRDPKYWPEPEKFDPERFIDSQLDFKGTHFELIPFGAGRRICPGMSLGLVSFEFILAMLLFHFDWELPEGSTPENLDMIENFGITMRRKNDLFIIPTPYPFSTSV